MAYGRNNPKRLSDYFGGRGRRKEAPVLSPGQPTRSQIETASKQKHKDFVMRDIEASHKRRAALETMWKDEEARELASRKQAVEEYKIYVDGAPDAELDTDGVLRAAYMNTPMGQTVTANMQAHIQASMNKSRRSDPNRPENRGPTQGEFEESKKVGERFTGYGRKIAGELTPTPVPEKPSTKKEITVKLPGGGKGTVTAKKGNKVKVIDRRTRKEAWHDIKDLEILERRGLDPITATDF
jgi:hypothetical protein